MTMSQFYLWVYFIFKRVLVVVLVFCFVVLFLFFVFGVHVSICMEMGRAETDFVSLPLLLLLYFQCKVLLNQKLDSTLAVFSGICDCIYFKL